MFKIDDSFEPHVGGSPLNIAVGLARLGEKVSYITKFSYDFFGDMLKDTLKSEGVDISLSVTDDDLHTTLAFAFVDEKKVPKFAIWNRSTADGALSYEDLSKVRIDEFDAFHFGSILFATPASDNILQFMGDVKKKGKYIFFDPNYRPHIAKDEGKYKADLLKGWKMADLVKCSMEDAKSIFNLDDFESILKVVKSIGKTVITDGENGAYVISKTATHIPAIRVNAVDTTGCGDAFMAGLIHDFARNDFKEENLVSASKFGTITAGMAAQKIGAITSFPKLEEVKRFLENLKEGFNG
ncbi:carbohydrate kinase family protein [Athalassotoga saccharophila]|uniref:carbohydrate kinase family protein n=1 Tax=Athalassotoga saccharophila TaxID=1441386 RepID=UPI00137A4517|nr:carbohydrate kinase [Athalassotoga saccharophila]BBJ27487.1 fructokinase [Athalassotoga saccharophila]